MEENEQYNNLLAGKIEELMDLEVLCKLKKASIEDEEDRPREPVTFDELSELAIHIIVT